ncbi:hypothetical protein Droror1_Dr00024180 [Drosera rotundifolia]
MEDAWAGSATTRPSDDDDGPDESGDDGGNKNEGGDAVWIRVSGTSCALMRKGNCELMVNKNDEIFLHGFEHGIFHILSKVFVGGEVVVQEIGSGAVCWLTGSIGRDTLGPNRTEVGPLAVVPGEARRRQTNTAVLDATVDGDQVRLAARRLGMMAGRRLRCRTTSWATGRCGRVCGWRHRRWWRDCGWAAWLGLGDAVAGRRGW